MTRSALLVLGFALTACEDDAAPDTPVEHGDHEHSEASEHGSSSKADAGAEDQANKEPKPDAAVQQQEKPAAEGGRAAAAPPAAEDDAGSGGDPLTIRFQVKLADKDFTCGKDYENQGTAATTVTPQDLRFFIQDLALIRQDGTRVPFTNEVRAPWQSETVALLDFEDATGHCAGTPETNHEITGSIEPGRYTGLSFAVGVPEDLNHSDATKQADPLKTSASLSWSWLSGFRFAKIELAKVDTETFGEGGFHPGSQACKGNPAAGDVTCGKPNRNEVVLADFDAAKHAVVLDVSALFAKTDLSTENVCHAGDRSVCEPMYDAWGVSFADGQPKPGQTVFKVTETP